MISAQQYQSVHSNNDSLMEANNADGLTSVLCAGVASTIQHLPLAKVESTAEYERTDYTPAAGKRSSDGILDDVAFKKRKLSVREIINNAKRSNEQSSIQNANTSVGGVVENDPMQLTRAADQIHEVDEKFTRVLSQVDDAIQSKRLNCLRTILDYGPYDVDFLKRIGSSLGVHLPVPGRIKRKGYLELLLEAIEKEFKV